MYVSCVHTSVQRIKVHVHVHVNEILIAMNYNCTKIAIANVTYMYIRNMMELWITKDERPKYSNIKQRVVGHMYVHMYMHV